MMINQIFRRLMLFSCVLSLISCRNRIKQDIEKLTSTPITLPLNIDIVVNGRDSLITNYYDSEYKLIIYADPDGCASCSVAKLYLWDPLIKYSETFNNRLKFYYIFGTQDSKKIKATLMSNDFSYPVLIDESMEFERLNPHIPKNKSMHTFLLDNNNNVLLIGDPLINKDVEKMFKDIVEEELGKKE